MSSAISDVIADAKRVLSQAPFGVCLLNEEEQVIWTNPTLRDQLGLPGPSAGQSAKGQSAGTSQPGATVQGEDGMHFDDLPISVEQSTGLCQPVRRPRLRLRMVVTPLHKGIKLAAFTDVTDLTAGSEGYAEILREIINTDSTTGLRNRAQIGRDLLAEISRSRRYGNELSVIRVKIGGAFSGMDNADKAEVSRQIAVRLADNLRTIDYAGQWSDDEFLIVLPETGADGAERLANKLDGVLVDVTNAAITIKCNVAEWRASDDLDTLLARTSAD